MKQERDSDFLTMPISSFADQAHTTRTRNQLNALEDFFEGKAPLKYAGQLLAFRRGVSWDSCFLAEDKGQRKLLPRKTSSYLADAMYTHGWKPKDLIHLRDQLLKPNPDDALKVLTDLASGVVELSWERSLEDARQRLSEPGLTREQFLERVEAFTDDELNSFVSSPEGPT